MSGEQVGAGADQVTVMSSCWKMTVWYTKMLTITRQLRRVKQGGGHHL